MAHCEMCGTDMPVSGGRCALGHPIAGTAHLVVEPVMPEVPVAEESPPLVPVPQSPVTAPQPPVLVPPPPATPQPPLPAASTPGETPAPPLPAPVVGPPLSTEAPAAPPLPPPVFDGALAVDVVPAFETEVPAAFAGPLVELVVAEERKPRIPKALGIFLSVLLVATGVSGYVVFGPGGASAEAAVYKRVYKAGERHDYTMTMAMRGQMGLGELNQPVNFAMNADVSERVLSIAPDGTSKVQFEVGFASVEANGRRMTLPGKIAITVHVARDGSVLSVDGAEGLSAGGANPMSGFFGPESMQPAFPKGKIAPGDKWTTHMSQKIPFGDKPLTVTTKNKLLRLETAHGIPVAVLHSVMEMPMNFTFTGKDVQKMSSFPGETLPPDATMTFSGKMTFDAIQTVVRETGRPIAVTGEGVFDVLMKFSGARVPAGAAIKMRMDLEVSFAEILGGQAA